MRRYLRIMPRGLFGRSLLIVMVPLVALQAVSAFVFYDRHWDDVGRRLALALGGDIAMMIDAIEAGRGTVDLQWMARRAHRNQGMDTVFRPGAALPETPPPRMFHPIDRMLARVLPEVLARPFRFDARSEPDLVSVYVEASGGLLRVTASRKRLFSSTIYIFVGWMVGTSIVLCAIAVFFLRGQVRPIRRLAEAAESFGKGAPTAEFRPQGAREVRQAARAFLRMRERIERHIAQRTEMLAGVSHDLRTPLTRMKLQLAVAGDNETTRGLEADVADMERMVEEYLAFARGEGGEEAAESDLDALVETVLAGARGGGKPVALVNRAPGLRPILRPNAVRRALTNLIDNALRYGRSARLTLSRRGESILVEIDDDGPGIPARDRENAFKPFSRLDSARGPDTGGVGLGLAIARDAVRNHGGDVELADSPLGGLRARVTLPL